MTRLRDADLARIEQFGVGGIDRDGSMKEPTAVEWLQAMNRKGRLGRKDWQFPENGGCGAFDDVQPYLYWSCAAATVQGPCRGQPVPNQEWSFSFGNGFQGTDILPNDLYVTAYYPSNP